MDENLTLKIFTPQKNVLNRKVYRVVLPYGKVNLTLIKDRAPTSLILQAGAVQILDKNDQVQEVYFIDGGVADIADNVCNLSVTKFLSGKDINRDFAEAESAKDTEEGCFYKAIADYFIAHPSLNN